MDMSSNFWSLAIFGDWQFLEISTLRGSIFSFFGWLSPNPFYSSGEGLGRYIHRHKESRSDPGVFPPRLSLLQSSRNIPEVAEDEELDEDMQEIYDEMNDEELD